MNKLRILLSFDHELSLGGATSYAGNLFEPTDRLLRLAHELGVPITLFTDVCCAIRFRDWDRAGFFDVYCDQVRRAIAAGHDVQLHLHPHWIDSHYENGKFIPANSYGLGRFLDRPGPNDVPGIVRQGTEFLSQLCRSQCPQYECIAYRAGGFDLAPGTAEILSALYDHGIRIESTIAKGNYFKSKLWQVDHSGMPAAANWYIARTGPLDREATSGLYEIPIAARPRTPINNLPFLLGRVLYRRRAYRSGGWGIDVGQTAPWDKLRRMFPRSVWMLGFDNFTHRVKDLMRILDYHVQQHSADELIACSTLSHPKSMGRHARQLMSGFVRQVSKDYAGRAEFCTYREFYHEFLAGRRQAAAGSAAATGESAALPS